MSLVKALPSSLSENNEAEALTATENTNDNTMSLDVAVQEGLLAGVTYDYVSMALSAADTTETWTFKTGGSGGTTVATVVIVYTTSDRDVISTVTRS